MFDRVGQENLDLGSKRKFDFFFVLLLRYRLIIYTALREIILKLKDSLLQRKLELCGSVVLQNRRRIAKEKS